jgi:hypothetical protein
MTIFQSERKRERPESKFQSQVLDLATRLGYVHYHTFNARRSDPGWPDLVLAHRDKARVLFIECKQDGKEPTAEQFAWLDLLAWCDEEVYIFHPKDWDEIAQILTLPQKPNKFARMDLKTAVVKM